MELRDRLHLLMWVTVVAGSDHGVVRLPVQGALVLAVPRVFGSILMLLEKPVNVLFKEVAVVLLLVWYRLCGDNILVRSLLFLGA